MDRSNTPAKPPIDLVSEIGFLPEWMIDEIADPLSTLSPGEAAKKGAALVALGNHLTENAKKTVFGAKGREDHGAVFDTIDTSSYPVVNNDAVKKQFPQEKFPGLYRTQTRKAYVTIDLPFNTKKIQQPSG